MKHLIISSSRRPNGLGLFAFFYLSLASVFFILADCSLLKAEVLTVEMANNHHCEVTPEVNGVFKVETNGDDPYFYIKPITAGKNLGSGGILSFDYFSTAGSSFLQVFIAPNVSESGSIMAPGIEPSQGWAHYWVDLSKLTKSRSPKSISGFRIDPGRKAGGIFYFKNFQWREPSQNEVRILEEESFKQKQESRAHNKLYDYLFEKNHPVQIAKSEYFRHSLRLEMRSKPQLKNTDSTYLAKFPFHASLTEIHLGKKVCRFDPDDDGRFIYLKNKVTFYDDVLSKYAVVRYSQYGERDPELLSPFRFVEIIGSGDKNPAYLPRNKKGLGALGMERPLTDIKQLGVSAVTVNILLSDFFNKKNADGSQVYQFDGREYFVSLAALQKYDKILRHARKHRLVVSAILLLPQIKSFRNKTIGHRLVHRDADPVGVFAMPYTDSEKGIEDYAFIIDLLSKRYNGGEKNQGLIHYWIIHNEVNSAWVWTNAGKKTALRYMNLYVKSMRLVDIISRRYNPHSKVFISLDHHWASKHGDKSFPGKLLLDYLVQYTSKEGDFEWALAHHPYPERLNDPKVWQDTQIDYSFETPKITFKNIEVLVSYLKQKRFLYKGDVRSVHLSEQGFNSPSYSEEDLLNQAAGLAYAWEKIRDLSPVEIFHYHNWVDNRHEGGLKIGLRKFVDDATEPLGKKPIWYLFKSLGTPDERKSMEFALPIIGISEWSEINR